MFWLLLAIGLGLTFLLHAALRQWQEMPPDIRAQWRDRGVKGAGLVLFLMLWRLPFLRRYLMAIPAWLASSQRSRAHWQNSGGGNAGQAGNDSAISEQEAYAMLGLKPGCSRAEVIAAHRELMRKLHPDAGGTDYLARRLNQARDILLKARSQ